MTRAYALQRKLATPPAGAAGAMAQRWAAPRAAFAPPPGSLSKIAARPFVQRQAIEGATEPQDLSQVNNPADEAAEALENSINSKMSEKSSEPDDQSKKGKASICGSKHSAWIPDRPLGYDFTSACYNHDNCYGENSTIDRLECDKVFVRELGWTCSKAVIPGPCFRLAEIYYRALRIFGKKNYYGRGSAK